MEDEPNPEIVSLDQLIEALGFKEDPKLQAVRSQINEAKTRGESEETLNGLFASYDDQAQSSLSDPDPDKYQRAALGLILAKARINKEIGWQEYYRYQIEDAVEIAEYADFVSEQEYNFIANL